MCRFRERFEGYSLGHSVHFCLPLTAAAAVLVLRFTDPFFLPGFLSVPCFVNFLRADVLTMGVVTVSLSGSGVFLLRFLGLGFRPLFFLAGP